MQHTPLMGYVSMACTFIAGVAGSIAVYGVTENSGVPKLVTIACIALTGGLAKISAGKLPKNEPTE